MGWKGNYDDLHEMFVAVYEDRGVLALKEVLLENCDDEATIQAEFELIVNTVPVE